MAWSLALTGIAWKSTAVLAVSLLIARVLSRNSAAVRHIVWASALAALAVFPLLSIAVPVWNLPASPEWLFVSGANARTVSTAPPAPAARTGNSSLPPEPSSWSPDWPITAAWIWAAGTCVLLARLGHSALLAVRLRRRSSASPNAVLAARIADGFRLRMRPQVLESSEVPAPMTFGIRRPVILLPLSSRHWDEERCRVVLLHEMAHILRGDFATQLVARIAVSLYWWNPLVWKAWSEFLKERERAADDVVLASGMEAASYAGHLLEVAREYRQLPGLQPSMVAMARPSDLESRLTAILDSRIRRRSAGSAPLLATLLAGAALALPLATLRAQTPDAHAPVEIEAAIRAARSQKNFDLLDQAAAAALRSREFDSARRLLDAALELRADAGGGKGSALYAAGLVRLGELERWQARDSAAETRFQEALAITKEGPDAFRALTALGAGRIAQEDFNTAADYFERAGRAAPVRAALAKMWLAVVRERQNNLPEADALFQSARALAGEESADAVVIARVHSKYLSRQHRPDEAAEAAAFASRALQSNPMPQASGNVYRVGGEVKPPKLLSKVEPEYSIEARSAKHEGMSKLVAEIGVDGRARNIRVLTPLGLFLDEKAMDAIAQWRFEPGTRNGVPVTVLATIEVNFRLL